MKTQLLAVASLLMGAASANPVQHAHHSHKQDAVAARDDGGYWYANMDHSGTARGYAPYADDPGQWNVFVAAKANDSQSVLDAINEGERDGMWFASTPRAVYVPPGTYEFKRDIKMHVDTIIYGDAKDPPVFKPSKEFSKQHQDFVKGQPDAVKGKGEQAFSIGLKNVILDLTDFQSDVQLTALNWSVAQNTQLQNVHIKLAEYSGNDDKGQVGMRMGRGSSLAHSGVIIEGGQYGIWFDGHQQSLFKDFTFHNTNVGVRVHSGKVVTLLGCTFENVGIAVLNDAGSPAINIVDCQSKNSGVTFSSDQYPSVMIESLDLDEKRSNIVEMSGNSYVLGPRTRVNTWSYGNTAGGNDPKHIYRVDTTSRARSEQVAPNGRLPLVSAPDYKDKSVTDFINVKEKEWNGGFEILGDNTRDESDNLQKVLNFAKNNGKIAYFPFGVYRVEKTLSIPVGLEIVGEAWATISGQGDAFKDENNPIPIVTIGNENDVGIMRISDMRFTVGEVCPGAIVVQINAAGQKPGDVGIWNSLITVGGLKGARDIANTCTHSNKQCKAAYNGLHLSASSSAYIENTWVWVADHQAEPDGASGIRIAAKAGVRVQATKGTWLYGLGSEHFWFYSLGLVDAQNVAVALLQAETNYDQGIKAPQNRQAPNPWTANQADGDPTFSTCKNAACRVGYAAWITGGSDIFLYGEGGYKFMDGTPQRDDGDANSQKYMNWINSTPDNLQLFGIVTHQSTNIIRLSEGNIISNKGYSGPWDAGMLGRYGPTNAEDMLDITV